MSPKLKELEQQALTLSARERAVLAEHLISSLDEMDKAEVERLWVAEAQRRYRAYRAGKIPSRSAETALREARTRLR